MILNTVIVLNAFLLWLDKTTKTTDVFALLATCVTRFWVVQVSNCIKDVVRVFTER